MAKTRAKKLTRPKPRARRSKYNNVRCEFQGKKFDSKAERDYYLVLLDDQRRGKISGLECQTVYVLQEKPRITYRSDFSMIEDGKKVAIDVKGAITAIFRLKQKMFEAKFPDVELRIVKAKRR